MVNIDEKSSWENPGWVTDEKRKMLMFAGMNEKGSRRNIGWRMNMTGKMFVFAGI